MRIGHMTFWTPQRLLAGFVLASILVHVVVFVWMPAWQRRMAEAPAPVLDVVLVAAPQMVVAEPAAVAPVPVASPQRRIESPKTNPLPPAVLSAPSVADAAPAVAAPIAEAPRIAAVESRAPAPAAEVPITPPLFNATYLRNPAPVYPSIARRSGEHGTVMLKVLVSAEGMPLKIELDQTSGSKSLDGAAQEAVKGWRFVPARRGTQNIEGWVRVPVVFRLDS